MPVQDTANTDRHTCAMNASQWLTAAATGANGTMAPDTREAWLTADDAVSAFRALALRDFLASVSPR